MPVATKRQARVYGVLAIVIGLFIVIQSFPLFVGSVLMIPGNPVLRSIQEREPVSEEDLRVLIESRRDALEWHQKGRTWTDLALAHMVLGEKLNGDARRAELENARQALRKGLAMAPANPHAWIRLALVLQELEGPSKGVADAVSLSLNTGPYERLLVFPKLSAGVPVWRYFDETDRRILKELTRQAWEKDPRRTTAIFRRANRAPLLFEILDLNPNPPAGSQLQ